MISFSSDESASGAVEYLEDELDAGDSLDYYEGEAEAGVFHGRGAAALGIDGDVVNRHKFERLLDGFSPGKEKIPLRQNAGDSSARPFKDVTISAPKSVSVLRAFAGEEERAALTRAHEVANAETMKYLEKHIRCRRGGGDGEKIKGAVFATFVHKTSRENDPQLHSHNILFNVCERADGSWGSIQHKSLYENRRAADAVYRATLARELRELGYHIERDETIKKADVFRVAGVPQKLCDVQSKRRGQIKTQMQKMGFSSAAAAEIASLQTRKNKSELHENDCLETWRAEAEVLGINPDKITDIALAAEVAALPMPSDVAHMRALTENSATFSDRDMVTYFAELAQYHDIEYEKEIERFKSRPEFIRLGLDGEDFIYTTEPMRSTEIAIVERAVEGAASRDHMVSTAKIKTAIAEFEERAGFKLIDEQRAAVEYAASTPGQTKIIQGVAGAGKTTAISAIRAAHEAAEFRVIGCAPTGAQADELKKAVPRSQTVAKTLDLIERGKLLLNKNDLVILDEAGMCGTRDLDKLQAEIARSGAKFILCGDRDQLESVAAGGMFRKLQEYAGTFGIAELKTISRQKEKRDRDVVYAARRGDVADAIENLDSRGHISTENTQKAATGKCVDDWLAARDPARPGDSLMVAQSNFARHGLNELAREKLRATGALGEDYGTKVTLGSDARSEQRGVPRSFAVGDRIVFERGNRDLQVKNGQCAHIDSIRVRANGSLDIEATHDNGRALQWNTGEFNNFTHGYCVTVHKSQSRTVQNCFVLTEPGGGYKAWSYVALSRARGSTKVYTTTDEREDLARYLSRDKSHSTTLDFKPIGALPSDRADWQRPIPSPSAVATPAPAPRAGVALAQHTIAALAGGGRMKPGMREDTPTATTRSARIRRDDEDEKSAKEIATEHERGLERER